MRPLGSTAFECDDVVLAGDSAVPRGDLAVPCGDPTVPHVPPVTCPPLAPSEFFDAAAFWLIA